MENSAPDPRNDRFLLVLRLVCSAPPGAAGRRIPQRIVIRLGTCSHTGHVREAARGKDGPVGDCACRGSLARRTLSLSSLLSIESASSRPQVAFHSVVRVLAARSPSSSWQYHFTPGTPLLSVPWCTHSWGPTQSSSKFPHANNFWNHHRDSSEKSSFVSLVMKKLVAFFTLLPPTANHQPPPPPAVTNRQPPTTANHHQPPITPASAPGPSSPGAPPLSNRHPPAGPGLLRPSPNPAATEGPNQTTALCKVGTGRRWGRWGTQRSPSHSARRSTLAQWKGLVAERPAWQNNGHMVCGSSRKYECWTSQFEHESNRYLGTRAHAHAMF